MIAFVDTAPKIADHHGHHLVTFTSGGGEVELLLTRNAMFHLVAASARAIREANEAQTASLVPFAPKRSKGK